MSFWYLATPYSKYPGGIVNAHKDACAEASLLVKAGVPVYCPIAHTHPIAIEGGMDPFDHETWLEADRAFMDAAKGLIVCEMAGWDESYGIEQEIKHFAKQGKPRIQMTPGVVPEELLRTRQIIGLCGYAGAGKDTAAAGLIADGWLRVAFADGVREALLALNPEIALADLSGYLIHWEGWDNLKANVPPVRELLQRMGTEAGRNIHGPDCWINIAKRKIDASTANVVITDVRFANEADAIRSWGGKVVYIERPGVGPVNGHVSEALDFEPDERLLNDSTPQLLQDELRDFAAEAIA